MTRLRTPEVTEQYAKAVRAVDSLATTLRVNGPGQIGLLDSMVISHQLIDTAVYFDMVQGTYKRPSCHCGNDGCEHS